MGEGFQRNVACAFQQFNKIRLVTQIIAQNQRVHKKTDQAFGFGAIAVGDGNTHAKVFLLGVTVEQSVKGGQKGHEYRGLLFGGNAADFLHNRPCNAAFAMAAAIRFYRRTRVIGR